MPKEIKLDIANLEDMNSYSEKLETDLKNVQEKVKEAEINLNQFLKKMEEERKVNQVELDALQATVIEIRGIEKYIRINLDIEKQKIILP